MKHQIDIAPNNAIYIDKKRVVGRKPYGFFETKTIRITDSDLVEIANRCEELTKRTANKPIKIDGFTEKCPKCGEKVMYAVGTGTIFHGASESYEDWRVITHDYCPRCGTKIEREGADNETD